VGFEITNNVDVTYKRHTLKNKYVTLHDMLIQPVSLFGRYMS